MSRPYLILLLSLIITIALTSESSSQSNLVVDSLEKVIADTKSDTVKAKALNLLGAELIYTNPKLALAHFENALELCEKSSFQSGIIGANNLIGHIHYMSGNYFEATTKWLKTLELRKLMNDKQGLAGNYIWLGNVSLIQANYVKALEYQFQAQAILEELDNKAWMGYTYNNIGAIYRAQEEFSKARAYFFKALKIDEELADTAGIIADLDNIGVICKDEKKYEEALEYYFRALKMKEYAQDTRGISVTLGNIGSAYADQAEEPGYVEKQRDSLQRIALQYFLNALELREELGDPILIASMRGNIGSLFIEIQRYEQAEEYLKEALSITDSIGVLSLVEFCHEQLADLYERTHRFKSAYEHFKAYSAMRDSLFNEEKSKDIGKLEAKHEFETVELQRKQKEEEQTNREAASKTRRDNLQYSAILIFLVSVFAGVFALGRISIPIRLAEGLIFFAFLLFFEFWWNLDQKQLMR